jgi:hypothetical protein
MKKFIIICALGVLSLSAVGCTSTMDLTDEENELVAEYAAELLMKYGTSIDLKYYENEAEEKADVEELETTTEAVTTTEASTETITEAVTDSEVTTVASSDSDTSESVQAATDMESVSDVAATKDSSYNLAEFLDESGVSIKYSYNMLLDTYPSYDQDGVYMEIQAPTGYKLLVLKFNVENTTNESRQIDLYNKNISYRIIVDDSKASRQMLTILMDDLYTYQKTMEPSMFEEDVLLFQVSDEVAEAMQDLKLEVTYEGNQVVLQLQ